MKSIEESAATSVTQHRVANTINSGIPTTTQTEDHAAIT